MKEQKKRSRIMVIGIWLLCVIGLLNSQSLVVQAEDLVTEDGYSYTLYRNGTGVAITEYTGNATVLEIPSTIDGKSVMRIDDFAFYACGGLTSVTIPNSVESIGKGAFYGCYNLTSITISNGL